MMVPAFDKEKKNIVGKAKNTSQQPFLLFQSGFLLFLRNSKKLSNI